MAAFILSVNVGNRGSTSPDTSRATTSWARATRTDWSACCTAADTPVAMVNHRASRRRSIGHIVKPVLTVRYNARMLRTRHLLPIVLLLVGRRRSLCSGGWTGLRRLLLARQARHDGRQYNDYIKGTAEKIDEDARKAGVFEEVVTVTPSQMGTSAAITDWTHLRIFKLKNRAAAEALSKGLDAATLRVVPDEDQRKRNSERSATLRDFVRQEIWTTLR